MIHLAKREKMNPLAAWGIRLAAFVLGLVVCGLLAFLMVDKLREQPGKIADFYKCFIDGISSSNAKSFFENRKLWVFMKNTAVLLCIALALTPAFRMRFLNIGGEGQTLVGVLAAIAVSLYLGGRKGEECLLPEWLLVVLMFVAAVLAGALWGLIPALFKAKWNTNETLFTLMMNYVATQLVSYFVKLWENPKGSNTVGVINQKSRIGWMPEILNKQFFSILIILAVMLFMYFYLKYSKHGFEISVVGESERTARYIGIKVEKVIVRTMLLSGAIAGLMGFILVSGVNHTISTTISGGRGFTGVMISWMSKFNPFVMILSSALLMFMQAGATDISTTFGLNQSFSDILTGIIIFFIIGSEFFINYKISFNKHGKETTEHV